MPVDVVTPVTGRSRRPPAWSVAALLLAVAAIVVALVVGLRGLLSDPVQGTDAAGVTTLSGNWEPFDCGTPCVGYIQAGAKSATVVLPAGCAHPARGASLLVRGRLDRSLGSATYRAVGCPDARR